MTDLVQTTERLAYFLDQIRLGNAYSEADLWQEITTARAAIDLAKRQRAEALKMLNDYRAAEKEETNA